MREMRTLIRVCMRGSTGDIHTHTHTMTGSVNCASLADSGVVSTLTSDAETS